MPMHTLQQGEDFVSLCAPLGIPWENVWELRENSALRLKRANPHILMPGDQLFLPEREGKQEACASEQKHRFRSSVGKMRFRSRLFNTPGKADAKREAGGINASEYVEEPPANLEEAPLKGVAYQLYVEQSLYAEGKTDAEGFLDETVPANARTGKLVINPGKEDEIQIELNWRHLNPIEEVSGICQRLTNLGIPAPQDASELTDEVKSALREFQQRQKLEQTGEPDDDTLQKLKEIHGS
jgi:N-acetylmuramoyl-L-alanine amidase